MIFSKSQNLLALSAVWLILALCLSYVAAAYLFPLETKSTSGLLGWDTKVETFFNYKAFMIAFSGMVVVNASIYLAFRQWVSGIFEIVWFALTLFVIDFLAEDYLFSTSIESGILGINTVEFLIFDTSTFIVIMVVSIMLNIWLRAGHFLWKRNELYSRQGAARMTLISLITVAFILYTVGLHLTLFKSTKLWIIEEEVTLIGSIDLFFEANERFLGIIIILFTIIFPLIKFIYLYWGILASQGAITRKVNNALSSIGKWSMLDVFIVALLLLNLKMDSEIVNMELRSGVWVFSISILMTMVLSLLLSKWSMKHAEKVI